MEFQQVVTSRRSIRAYENRPIEDGDLQAILEAGMYAPSAVNFQPWYFVVIRSKEHLVHLAEIMARVSAKIEPDLKERFAKHPAVVEETTKFIRRMGGAPVCILAFQLKPDYGKTDSTIIQSVSAALENILLAAVDRGLGGCWLTAPLEAGADEEMRRSFAPDKGRLVAMLTLGYPAHTPKAPPRKEGRYIIL